MSVFAPGLLEGKTAFVAGGSSGINPGIAHGLGAAPALRATKALMLRTQAIAAALEADRAAFPAQIATPEAAAAFAARKRPAS